MVNDHTVGWGRVWLSRFLTWIGYPFLIPHGSDKSCLVLSFLPCHSFPFPYFLITKDLLGIAKYIYIQHVIHVFEKNAYWKLWRGKKLSMRHESFDPKDIEYGYFIHVRNFDGQTLPHPTVRSHQNLAFWTFKVLFPCLKLVFWVWKKIFS